VGGGQEEEEGAVVLNIQSRSSEPTQSVEGHGKEGEGGEDWEEGEMLYGSPFLINLSLSLSLCLSLSLSLFLSLSLSLSLPPSLPGP
jgi:hypothetical protein